MRSGNTFHISSLRIVHICDIAQPVVRRCLPNSVSLQPAARRPSNIHGYHGMILNGAFPLQGLAWLSTVWLGLGRPGSLHAAFPLQFSSWGSNYSNAV